MKKNFGRIAAVIITLAAVFLLVNSAFVIGKISMVLCGSLGRLSG